MHKHASSDRSADTQEEKGHMRARTPALNVMDTWIHVHLEPVPHTEKVQGYILINKGLALQRVDTPSKACLPQRGVGETPPDLLTTRQVTCYIQSVAAL